ncbi:MAG TPA: YncE family protein [Reyranella sp.]|nr:YncE family protein [Reyranella sp.]
MPLKRNGHVELPANRGKGGFDHAYVHAASGHVYVAHTANDAIDVLDDEKHLFSIAGLKAVAGALVSDADNLIFSSNRGEDTVGIFPAGPDPAVIKVEVGAAPNGLSYDPGRKLLLAAGLATLSVVDVQALKARATFPAPGRTRWTVFDAEAGLFYVNVMDPAVIAVVDARKPDRLAHMFAVPAAGPHGLDFDPDTRRLFCACDAARLFALDARSGKILAEAPLSGTPDVVWFNRALRQLYVAIGDPGVIDVFDTRTLQRTGTVETERGAHTTALSPAGDRLYAFLPQSHRAALFHCT